MVLIFSELVLVSGGLILQHSLLTELRKETEVHCTMTYILQWGRNHGPFDMPFVCTVNTAHKNKSYVKDNNEIYLH